jgi:hypothetical protein
MVCMSWAAARSGLRVASGPPMPVRTQPGWTATTMTPVLASSPAVRTVTALSAALAAL